jgi:hypothetical protein
MSVTGPTESSLWTSAPIAHKTPDASPEPHSHPYLKGSNREDCLNSGEMFKFSILCVSFIADLSNTWRLERRISYFHCDININSLRAHPRRKRSITAPIDYKNIRIIKGDIARLSNANLWRPRRGRRGWRGRPQARAEQAPADARGRRGARGKLAA